MLTRLEIMRVYLDNNVYNYMVDEKKIESSEVKIIVNAVKIHKLEVLFSPVNLFEIVRSYERKANKAKEMIELSFSLSNEVSESSTEILFNQLNTFDKQGNFSHSHNDLKSSNFFNNIRQCIFEKEDYHVPMQYHDEINRIDKEYIGDLKKMKSEINRMLQNSKNGVSENNINRNEVQPRVDFYKTFNEDYETRTSFIDAFLTDRYRIKGDYARISSFDNIPSLAMILKYYFKFVYELIVQDKEPKSGDWADLEQTIYFYYVDYVVTSDTGMAGLFPNYREILNEILQPMNKSAIKFSTLLKKLERNK